MTLFHPKKMYGYISSIKCPNLFKILWMNFLILYLFFSFLYEWRKWDKWCRVVRAFAFTQFSEPNTHLLKTLCKKSSALVQRNLTTLQTQGKSLTKPHLYRCTFQKYRLGFAHGNTLLACQNLWKIPHPILRNVTNFSLISQPYEQNYDNNIQAQEEISSICLGHLGPI